MRDPLTTLFEDFDRGRLSRRDLFKALGIAAVGAPLARSLGQGRCVTSLGSPACVTAPIKPVFEPTGWKTVALDHMAFTVGDYKKEAAFYTALMGWKLRSDDGKQAVMDVGDWGGCIFRAAPAGPAPDTTAGAGGRGGRGGAAGRARLTSFCFAIDQWDAKKVEAELKKRGLAPVADNDGKGFESFHVKDPDGWDLQISNSNGLVKARKTPATAQHTVPMPFDSTGWKTTWLDHFSFGVTNYKESASFYESLLGWTPTYDEGSQIEVHIGDVGNTIIRGGNPLAPPSAGRGGRGRAGGADSAVRPVPAPGTPVQLTRQPASVDHISFGISPWDTDAVRAELEKRKLTVSIDTSSKHWDDATKRYVNDEIHTAAFRSYHTTTPSGYNLQISWMHKDIRDNLANAVRPKPPGGPGGTR